MKKNFKKSDYEAILEKSGGVCGICNSNQLDVAPHHIVPKSAGGIGTIENGVWLCRLCHHKLHFSKESLHYKDLTYPFLGDDLSKTYSGKIKPKVINQIEQDRLESAFF